MIQHTQESLQFRDVCGGGKTVDRFDFAGVDVDTCAVNDVPEIPNRVFCEFTFLVERQACLCYPLKYLSQNAVSCVGSSGA